MNSRIFCVLAITLLLILPANAESIADLVQAGVGARPLGMGRAFTGVEGGVNSICFNPAGISRTATFEITTMQTKIVNVVDYKMYGGVYSTKYGTFGLAYLLAATPAGYLTTDRASMNGAPTINYSATTLILSYGQVMTRLINTRGSIGNLALGGNLKLTRNSMSGVTNGNGSGIDMDLGAHMIASPDLNFGATLQNCLRGKVGWDTGKSDALPVILKVGATYKPKKANVLLSLDCDAYSSDKRPYLLHLGGEWAVNDTLIIRGGLDQAAVTTTEKVISLSYGIGLKFLGAVFDYAYRSDAVQKEASAHYISLSYSPEN